MVRDFVKTQIETEYSEEKELIKLHFDGYFGGHSGMEIDKNRRNMIKTITEFIRESRLSLASFNSGK